MKYFLKIVIVAFTILLLSACGEGEDTGEDAPLNDIQRTGVSNLIDKDIKTKYFESDAVGLAPAKATYNTNAGLSDVRGGSIYKVPNDINDKNSTWDILSVYYENYKKNIEIVIIDGDTKAVKKVHTTGASFNGMVNVIAPDGRLYMVSGKANGTVKPQINIYDPKTNEFKFDAIELPDNIYGNTYNGIQISTDGHMFIYAVDSGDKGNANGNAYKPRIFEIDFENEVVLSDSGPLLTPKGIWKVCADNKYVYLLTGKLPWGVVQYERAEPHNVKVIPTTNTTNIMQSAYGVVIEGRRYHGDKGFLYEGSTYNANTADGNDWRKSKNVPWAFPDGYNDFDKWYTLVVRTNIVDRFLPNKPKLVTDNTSVINGAAQLYIAQPKDIKKIDKDTTDINYTRYDYNISTYPTIINRVVKLSDTKVMAGSNGYGPYVIYDTINDTYTKSPGSLGVSLSTMIEHNGKVYMSGYPRGVLFEYDPTKEWTQGIHNYDPNIPSTKTDMRDQDLNPRWCGKLAEHGSGAHKIYASAKGSDGNLYFGGQWMRDGNGGGLAWYNPATKEMGGISKPFVNYAIQHLTPVNGGDYIAIATVAVTSADGYKPATSKIFIFDTAKKKIINTLDPLYDIKRSIPGQIISAEEDYLVGLSTHVNQETLKNDGKTYIYKINIHTGKIVYKHLYDRKVFEHNFAVGNTITLDEDGQVVTWLGLRVVKIDPKNGAITTIANFTMPSTRDASKVYNGVQGDAVYMNNALYVGRHNTLLKLDLID
ncbi:hypothetical protein MNB_SM-4-540 [hydrothermal vent metagenome]|uniref:Uncharacterized protein n=1 Tax=hydrothermal vent metagenome TaxID=652676 RepID=A0A1W1BD65_9ZZZZ